MVEYTVGGVTHRYYQNGMTILAEDRESGTGTDRLYYYYDADGVAGFQYNGTDYYYQKNIQGEITHILDGTGAVVASYRYDTWGNVLEKTGILADVNPFRYRGYYQDNETGLFLQGSRYYDPEVGWFINADSNDNKRLQSHDNNGLNLYAYYLNNPI